MKNISGKYFSHAAGVFNEDICFLSDAYAWVIDGSSGLTAARITDGESDAKWFVSEWDKYLKENIMKQKSIREILENGTVEIRNKFFSFKNASKAAKIEQPSASIIIVRHMGKYLEYFGLGDCTLLFKLNSGEVIRVFDGKVAALDSKVINKMYEIHKEKNIPLADARVYVKDMLQQHRLMKNSDDGYWILGMEEEAIAYGVYDKLKMEDVQKVCMLSDGFAQHYDTLHLSNDCKDFLDKAGRTSLDKLYEELWEAQEQDKTCSKFPRLKVRDDASIVYFEV